jgi:TetR/AcrR family fatty acid metabolism transcriptional regulator
MGFKRGWDNMNNVQQFFSKSKKERILQAAECIFGKEDYANATISQIAKYANVAVGTVYEYFESKETLFFSIASEKCEVFDRELELHLSGIVNAFEKIRKYIWFYFYFFQSEPVYGELLLLNMRVNKNFKKSPAYAWISKSTGEIITILKEGKKEGLIREDVDVYTMRHMILGSLEHIATRWLLQGKDYDIMAYSERVSNLIIKALCRD